VCKHNLNSCLLVRYLFVLYLCTFPYHDLAEKKEYAELGEDYLDQLDRQGKEKRLVRQLQNLGDLTPTLWRSETLEYTLPEGGKGSYSVSPARMESRPVMFEQAMC
jgi:hypothetical protein